MRIAKFLKEAHDISSFVEPSTHLEIPSIPSICELTSDKNCHVPAHELIDVTWQPSIDMAIAIGLGF